MRSKPRSLTERASLMSTALADFAIASPANAANPASTCDGKQAHQMICPPQLQGSNGSGVQCKGSGYQGVVIPPLQDYQMQPYGLMTTRAFHSHPCMGASALTLRRDSSADAWTAMALLGTAARTTLHGFSGQVSNIFLAGYRTPTCQYNG